MRKAVQKDEILQKFANFVTKEACWQIIVKHRTIPNVLLLKFHKRYIEHDVEHSNLSNKLSLNVAKNNHRENVSLYEAATICTNKGCAYYREYSSSFYTLY